ncbi:MAG TPA: nuclear transport factor 2 family protein [Anaerolineaceae bacterium]|nr:nuclear transport factor 2 family protein [Anaerolineaceae bacterium]
MDSKTVENWVEGYTQAWNSNDPADIGALFSEDARYYTSPFVETPWRGRDAIIQHWLQGKDEPGSFRFRYEVLAAAGDTGVMRGWTLYLQPQREYANIWVIRFDDQGRCREFTEFFMQRP